MIRFSVITIVRNDAPGVIRTLQSTFNQRYDNFEIIVQDGASNDGTSDLLHRFGDWIDSLAIEADDGIYDAMNRALVRATGDYCIFMNAGDFFIDNKVLGQVAERIDPDVDDIWAGQAMSDERGTIHKYRPRDQFWAGSTFDHQATFIRTSLNKKLKYDTRFGVSGDLNFFTRARLRGAHFNHNDLVVARKPFAVGASSNFLTRVKDRVGMLEEAWGDRYPVKEKLFNELRRNTVVDYDLDLQFIADMSFEELLSERECWDKFLRR